MIAYMNFIGTIIYQYLTAYKIDSQSDKTIISQVANNMSLIVCIGLSIVVDYVKRYKIIFVILIIFALLNQVTMTLLLEIVSLNNYSTIFRIILILETFIMCSVFPFFAIGMDYVCEITYPVSELISCGIILVTSQILGIIETYICSYFIEVLKKPFYVNLLNSFVFLFALIILVYLKEELLRNNADVEKPIELTTNKDLNNLKENEEIKV